MSESSFARKAVEDAQKTLADIQKNPPIKPEELRIIVRARAEAEQSLRDSLQRNGILGPAFLEANERQMRQIRDLVLNIVEQMPKFDFLAGLQAQFAELARMTKIDFPKLGPLFSPDVLEALAHPAMPTLPAPYSPPPRVRRISQLEGELLAARHELADERARSERLEEEVREMRNSAAFESTQYPELPPEYFGKN